MKFEQSCGKHFRFLISLMLFLVIWHVLVILKLVNTRILSSPLEIVNAFLQMINSGSLITDLVLSVKRVLIGVFAGSGAGLLVAFIFGFCKKIQDYTGFLIEIIRPIPPIAWIPIAILWFGIGDAPAYFLVSLGSFFPIFTCTLKSIRGVEKKYINIAKSFGASKRVIFQRIIIPLLLPDILAGLKIGVGVGWIIVITAEMAGAQNGLGYMIQLNRIMLQTPNVIAGMIVIGIFGAILSALLNWVEQITMPWKKRMDILERQSK